MTSDLEIRPAAPNEYDLIGDLSVASYSAGGHLHPEDDYAATLRDVRARASQTDVLVAVREGEIVGTVTICPIGSDYAEVGRNGESEFRFLAVSPTAWRMGVGEALVAACEDLAVTRGAPAHVICVIDKNTAAQKFYDRLGFTRLPDRDWEPREGVFLEAWSRAVPYA